MPTSKRKQLTAKAFDAAFEQSDVTKHLDLQSLKARYPSQRISIDFPKEILEEVDVEAAKIGVTRTDLIKMWVAQRLKYVS